MSDSPTDGWHMVTGVWGTDADEDTTTVNTLGDSSVQMLSTAVATKITTDFIPIEAAQPYSFRAAVQASSISTGPPAHTVELSVNQYLADKSLIGGFNWFPASVLPGAATWYELSTVLNMAANAKYIKLVAAKAAELFTVNIDLAEMKQHPHAFRAWQSTDTTLATATWTQIQFQEESYDYGFTYLYSAGGPTSEFTARREGIHHFDTHVLFDNTIADGTTVALALYKDTGGGAAEVVRLANEATSKTNEFWGMGGSADLYLNRGDIVSVYGYQAEGVNNNTEQSNAWCWFSGHQIG